MKGSTLLQVMILIVCACLLYNGYMSEKEFELLHMENQMLWEKLDSLQSIPSATPAKSSTASMGTSAKSSASSLLNEIFSDLQKDYQDSKKESQKKAATTKIVVESSYRIEDRYVSYRVHEPEKMPTEPGVVIIDIEVNYAGDVKKTTVNAASTINDESILDACRKAALQTDFNYDSDKGYQTTQKGTITYTFKKK